MSEYYVMRNLLEKYSSRDVLYDERTVCVDILDKLWSFCIVAARSMMIDG